MNMQISGRSIKHIVCLISICGLIFFSSCQDEYLVYGIEDVDITPVNSEKDKPKTHAQYISILYANMFQKAIGPNQMLQALNAIESIGDKQVAYDMLVSKYMNDPDVKIPTIESMRNDPETFVRDTYTRFLVRQPTEAELQWMINYIDSRPSLTPELVFFSFATSNEHAHY